MHAGERRIIATLADPRLGVDTEWGGREAFHDVDVPLRVAEPQLVVRGRLGGESRLRANRAQETQARPEPARRERVAGPEVVGPGARAVDQQHAWHDTGMERVYTTPLLDKLGMRPGMRVALIDIEDDSIRPLLAERTSDITEGWPEPDTDIVFLGADSTEALEPLVALAGRIRPNGSIWVVSRKGKSATLRDVEVIDAARAAGLVDNKVVSFSPTHTSLRLVIPLALRPK